MPWEVRLSKRLYFYRSLQIRHRSLTTKYIAQNGASCSSWTMCYDTSFWITTTKSWKALTPFAYPTCLFCSYPRTQHQLCKPSTLTSFALKQFYRCKLCVRIFSEYDKVVDNLADLSNNKPIILDVSTTVDVTSFSFHDFDIFFEESKKINNQAINEVQTP